jgi:hypothetical protein
MPSRLIRCKVPEDRYSGALFVERPRKDRTEDAEGSRVKSAGDTQPVYKVKPNTGDLRGKKRR